MSFQDKSIQCSDCRTVFAFTAREQEFFASKGFANEPKRCPQCRKTRKQQRRGPSGTWASYANKAMLATEFQKI